MSVPNFRKQCLLCGDKKVSRLVVNGKRATKKIEVSSKDPKRDGLRTFDVYRCTSCKTNYPIPF